MSTPVIAFSMLFFASLLFGSLPFIGGFRALPRWIRIALLMIGLSFFTGTAVGVALHLTGTRLSPRMHQFLVLQIMLILGMGVGIILLLLFSGEYFKALRELDATRRKRLADTHEERGHEHV